MHDLYVMPNEIIFTQFLYLYFLLLPTTYYLLQLPILNIYIYIHTIQHIMTYIGSYSYSRLLEITKAKAKIEPNKAPVCDAIPFHRYA